MNLMKMALSTLLFTFTLSANARITNNKEEKALYIKAIAIALEKNSFNMHCSQGTVKGFTNTLEDSLDSMSLSISGGSQPLLEFSLSLDDRPLYTISVETTEDFKKVNSIKLFEHMSELENSGDLLNPVLKENFTRKLRRHCTEKT